MSTTGARPLADVGTLVFDVLGTVVDEAGSVAAETARALATSPGVARAARRRRTSSMCTPRTWPTWPHSSSRPAEHRVRLASSPAARPGRLSTLCRAGKGRHA